MWRTGLGGVHFIVRDLPLHWEEAAEERALFRDDANRLDLDLACVVKPTQILFSRKRDDRHQNYRERWPLDVQSLLALPFWRSRIVIKRHES